MKDPLQVLAAGMCLAFGLTRVRRVRWAFRVTIAGTETAMRWMCLRGRVSESHQGMDRSILLFHDYEDHCHGWH